jgi:hypothetical protein
MAIAAAYSSKFSFKFTRNHRSVYKKQEMVYKVHSESLYNFLYEHDYQAWFCNASRKIFDRESLKRWLLRLHTGEALAKALPESSQDKRRARGQQYLHKLARDFLAFHEENSHDGRMDTRYKFEYDELIKRLEIDGYILRDGKLYMASKEHVLLTLAAKQFPDLTDAERKLLQAVTTGEPVEHHSPNNAENDPRQADTWDVSRTIRAKVVRWLFAEPEASRQIDPHGNRQHRSGPNPINSWPRRCARAATKLKRSGC